MDDLIGVWQIFFKSKGSAATREALFIRIWDLYHKRILFFIRQMAPNDADDLMQDVMLRVFENLDRYNPVFSFDTWIFTIARNRTKNWKQKKKPELMDSLHEVSEAEELSAESALLAEETRRKVNEVIGRLDPEQKQLVYLTYYEGLKNRQTAKILGIPAGTVKSRLYWIRDRLKNQLGEDNAD